MGIFGKEKLVVIRSQIPNNCMDFKVFGFSIDFTMDLIKSSYILVNNWVLVHSWR